MKFSQARAGQRVRIVDPLHKAVEWWGNDFIILGLDPASKTARIERAGVNPTDSHDWSLRIRLNEIEAQETNGNRLRDAATKLSSLEGKAIQVARDLQRFADTSLYSEITDEHRAWRKVVEQIESAAEQLSYARRRIEEYLKEAVDEPGESDQE